MFNLKLKFGSDDEIWHVVRSKRQCSVEISMVLDMFCNLCLRSHLDLNNMNILTKIRLLNDLNERELRLGIAGTKASWHEQYRQSAWIYTGGLPFELSEGDVICVFSQYGEIVNINMIRDRKTGKSKGFAFVCYEDQRSTILAVDNLNGTKIKGRQIRVDHVANYKPPKDDDEIDELTKHIREEGIAPKLQMPESSLQQSSSRQRESSDEDKKPKHKKRKKEHKELKFLKKHKLHKKSKHADSWRQM